MYYSEQQIDPPSNSIQNENALYDADKIVENIRKLYDNAETFFDELTLSQMEDIFDEAEYFLDILLNMFNEHEIIEDQYSDARWMVDDIEGWLREKQEAIKI